MKYIILTGIICFITLLVIFPAVMLSIVVISLGYQFYLFTTTKFEDDHHEYID